MSSLLPESPRSLTEADAGAAAAVLCDLERAVGYRGTATGADLLEWWSHGELAANSWAFEADGSLLGFAWLAPYGEIADVAGVVAPAAWGRGLGARLVELGESRARELGFGRVHQHVYGAERRGRALLESRGYRDVRFFLEMVLDLDAPPPPPRWPHGVSAAGFRDEDARVFWETVTEAFAGEWEFIPTEFEEWRRRRVEQADTSLYFLARSATEVAGAIRCESEHRGMGWVGTLGVRPGWRGRGIGRALLLHAFGAFYERDIRRVGLGVDSDNPTGAVRLYESVGMRVTLEDVVYEKDLG